MALEVTDGPVIEFHPGRRDKVAKEAVPNGRLPEAEHGLGEGVDSEGRINGWENLAQHVRDVFNRMGFNDRESECNISSPGPNLTTASSHSCCLVVWWACVWEMPSKPHRVRRCMGRRADEV